MNAGDTSWGSWGATTSTENKVDNSEVWGSWGATTCTENKVDESEVWGGSGGWGEANSGGTTEAHAEIVEKQVDEGIEGHGFKDDKRQANNPQRASLVHDVNRTGVIKASDSVCCSESLISVTNRVFLLGGHTSIVTRKQTLNDASSSTSSNKCDSYWSGCST